MSIRNKVVFEQSMKNSDQLGHPFCTMKVIVLLDLHDVSLTIICRECRNESENALLTC